MADKTKNLKPIQSTKEAREKGKKGGIKSGEVRRARKTLKDELLFLLEQGDIQAKITLAMIKQAQKGNVKAYAVIRDTIGEKPAEKQEITGKDGTPLMEKVIYVTLEEQQEVKEHIQNTING